MKSGVALVISQSRSNILLGSYKIQVCRLSPQSPQSLKGPTVDGVGVRDERIVQESHVQCVNG